MDSLIASGSVDTRRLYVGGLSMGGMGTFDMLARFPDRFAAAFPICGAGDESLAGRYAKTTALWIFHGSADAVMPPNSSRLFYANLKKEGADVKYTEYPGVGHNSWDNAFAEPELFPWLFSHALKQ
jgi:predicted peptidase